MSSILQATINRKICTLEAVPHHNEPNRFIIGARAGLGHNWLAAVQMNGELMEAQQKRIVELMAMAPELRAALQDAHDRLAVILGAGYPKVRELRLLLDRTPEVAP